MPPPLDPPPAPAHPPRNPRAALPIIAGGGGMIVPAAIFLYVVSRVSPTSAELGSLESVANK